MFMLEIRLNLVRSLLHIVYINDYDRTLTEEEVDTLLERLLIK